MNTPLLLAVSTFGFLLVPPWSLAEDEKPYLGKVFFGIEGKEVPVPADPRYESTWGLELERVAALSSGRLAGLRVGDIVVPIDGTVWKNEQIRLSRSFGIAFDEGGSDRMEAGNFSQGGGYFYGFGVLYAGGTEGDSYIGSRYAQGFGCHQAAGVMIDAGGDDRYSTRSAVAQGLSWDESVSLFLDLAGNDRCEGGGFSHAASANNGFALFLELGGDDTYLYTDQARAGGNDYHGGKSLSFFVDLSGGKDTYPSRTNDAVAFGEASSVFVDAPGELTELLDDTVRGRLNRTEPQP